MPSKNKPVMFIKPVELWKLSAQLNEQCKKFLETDFSTVELIALSANCEELTDKFYKWQQDMEEHFAQRTSSS